MLFEVILAFWGCMSELDSLCTKGFDMTNAASTWVGLIAGVGIGAVITWWIYNRQEKTSKKQEIILESISSMLEIVEIHQEKNQSHQEKVLSEILSLNKKIDSILEKK